VTEEQQLRREIAQEREELTGAVGSLREELQRAKRRVPAMAAGGIALLTALRLGLRRLRRRR
jgi:hypothetical protein